MSGGIPACAYSIEGNPAGPTLVFVHGWPDNANLWRKQVEALGARFRCVLITLPNYGRDPERRGGFDFPQVAERIAAVIRAVEPGGKVGLVTHDWGAYIGYLVEQRYPEAIERMAAFDVGGHLRPLSPKAALMIVSYQWPLIAAWLAGGLLPPLGALMTRGVGRIVRVPSRQQAAIRSHYNYLYYYYWRNTLLPRRRRGLLLRYRPRCPVMYLYGENKPVMFHSPRWLEIVEESGGYVEGVAGAGHWLMETHAEQVNERLQDWFRDFATGA